MQIWTYDRKTGELIGQQTADADPLTPESFLFPAFSTVTPPPAIEAGQIARWTGATWEMVPDHRGETWYGGESGREPFTVTEIGTPVDLMPTPTAVPLSEAKGARIAEAWATMQTRVQSGVVSVTTAAGTHQYGLDAVTQDNVQKALLGVLTGLSPNPRPWTPKGVSAPISITHDEVKLIAGSIGFAYEAHVQAYLVHKSAIAALTTSAAVAEYDLTQGWPA